MASPRSHRSLPIVVPCSQRDIELRFYQHWCKLNVHPPLRYLDLPPHGVGAATDRAGPLTLTHELLKSPEGRPSSVIVHCTIVLVDESESVIVLSAPTLSSGRAFIPENLVDDFGAQNLYSQRVARALYHALEGHTDDLTANLFRQWQLFFSQVSGYEEPTARLREHIPHH